MDVTIDIGAGTFTPTSTLDEILIEGGGEKSLTLRGAGAGDTTLRTAQGTAQFKGSAITVLDGTTFPVTVTDVTVEGAGQDDATAIADLADHTLRLAAMHITGLRAAAGKSAIGVLDTNGRTEITQTLIDDLQGATGSTTSGNSAGGLGGNAQGVLVLNNTLSMDSSTITDIRGGNGGQGGPHGGQGGTGNVGIGVSGGGPGARISDSTITAITGGAPGQPGQGGAAGVGGQGYGVWFEGEADDPATLTHLTVLGTDRGALLEHATLRASLLDNTENCTPGVGYLDGGYNVTTDAASGGCFTEQTDVVGFTPAALDTLAANGGPTPTVELDGRLPCRDRRHGIRAVRRPHRGGRQPGYRPTRPRALPTPAELRRRRLPAERARRAPRVRCRAGGPGVWRIHESADLLIVRSDYVQAELLTEP